MNRKMVAAELVKIAKMLSGSTGYAWQIDNDQINERHHRKGTMGPRGANPELVELLRKGEGDKFTMYDDDRIPYYSGRIVGDYDGFEPMDDFGTPDAGCTMIKYTSGPNRGGFL